MSIEIWKPVAGFESDYEISSHGRIKALAKEINCSRWGRPCVQHNKERILKCSKDISGYLAFALTKDKCRTRVLVHRLVYRTFVGEIPEGKEINHRDGVKGNPSLENLELCTRKENVEHAHRTGLRRLSPQGTEILSEEDKKTIRFFYQPGIPGKHFSADIKNILSKIFNKGPQTIYRIGKCQNL